MADKPEDNSTSPPPTGPPPTGLPTGQPPAGQPPAGPPPTGPPPAPGPSRSRDQTDGTEASGSQPPVEMARNKHWRYITSYHGPWAQMPCEELEAIAKSNWALPRPRAIDPAVFFDLVKVRKLAEEACDLAVRATAGIATSALSNPFTIAKSIQGSGVEALGLGSFGPGTGAPLSAERKFRMRDQATQKLSKAYHLDELASSIVTMQGASTLARVAEQLIETPRENLDPLDGKYVHYFHERTNAEALKKPEALTLLDEVISGRHLSAEPLRTRAVAKMHQQKYLEAVEDLTRALQICRYQQSLHKPEPQESQNTSASDSSKCKEKKVDENDYPSSLEAQLLFHRAEAYLDLACQAVEEALPSKDDKTLQKTQGSSTQSSSMGASNERERRRPSVGADPEAMEREKKGRSVKENAKRALRDYLAYLSHLDYTPELDPKHMEGFVRRVHQAAAGAKLPKGQTGSSSNPSSGIPPPVVHQISSLFSATPPTGLPSDPQTDILIDHSSAAKNNPLASENTPGTSAIHEAAQQLFDSTNKHESLTYHPLLVEALHCLLLCHVLMQTSIRELQRHAHMAARLIRSCDGYPIFETPRAVSSREDWLEILSRAGEKFALGASWEVLCRPRLYRRGGIPPIFTEKDGSMKETEDEKRERLHKQAVLETLGDRSITDDETFKKALAARQRRQEEEERRSTGKADEQKDGASKNKAQDDEHVIGSIRARSIKKRNRTRGHGRGSARSRGTLNSSMGGMSITDKSVETPNEEAD
ncbi:hypothetical protein V500_02399 [Pseudogymnoascus sp. VKM F-4518 (FW-2643)]|nr:hypothetical protein V500_02399 [Pseudogymnoascus sp. VKM F-4518 (FW-2643)]